MRENITAFTDALLGLQALYLSRRFLKGPRPGPEACFFLFLAAASFAGGATHLRTALGHDITWTWKSTVLAMAGLTASLWALFVGRLPLRETGRFVAWALVSLQAVGLVAYALLTEPDFLVVVGNYFPATVAVFALAVRRGGLRHPLAVGLGISWLAAVPLVVGWDPAPEFFDRNALYHCVQMLGLVFIARGLGDPSSGKPGGLGVLLLALLAAGPALGGEAQKPGNEHVLREGQGEATLYLTTVHREPGGRVLASWAWVPEDVESLCRGKTLRECRELDGCYQYPTAQKCGKDLSHCVPFVHPHCEALGFTLENWKGRVRKGEKVPYALQENLPYGLAKASEGILRKWGVPLDFTGSRPQPTLDAKRSVRAKVKWAEWTNGFSFEVLAYLP